MANEQCAMSPSMHVPLRLLLEGYGGSDNSADRQLALYTPQPPATRFCSSSSALTASRFKLPEGWEVEEVPRADASRVDKYYYEPMTGHKFRSLREVERYVNGEVCTPRRRRSKTLKLGYRGSSRKKSSYRKMIVSGGQMLRLDEEDSTQYNMAIVPASSTAFNSPYKLPNGWVVEEVPRSRGGNIDKYYYEPGTGRKFRSLLSVDKYLTEVSENTSLSETLAELREYNIPLSKAFKIGGHVKNPNPWKPTIPRDKVQSSTFNAPPMKISWVIASPEGDSWNPYIGGSLVPESVKQQWSKRFMLSINDGRYEAPNF